MTSSIQYISTRGQDTAISFADALLAGLARDGGLYLPTAWPQFAKGELEAMASMPYAEVLPASWLNLQVMIYHLMNC